MDRSMGDRAFHKQGILEKKFLAELLDEINFDESISHVYFCLSRSGGQFSWFRQESEDFDQHF